MRDFEGTTRRKIIIERLLFQIYIPAWVLMGTHCFALVEERQRKPIRQKVRAKRGPTPEIINAPARAHRFVSIQNRK